MYEVYGGTLRDEICITIDGKEVYCKEGTSILKAAQQVGIEIPTLCYMKGLTPTGACGMCAVEIVKNGERVIRHACRYRAKDGMEIYTETEAVIAYRTKKMEHILQYHPMDCFFCPKNAGNCRLQEVAKDLKIRGERLGGSNRGVDDSTSAIVRDMDKCIGCGRCLRVCRDVQKLDVFAYFKDEMGHRYVSTKDRKPLSETKCISCGQCVKVCPVGALVENRWVEQANAILSDLSKTVIWQVDPTVFLTIGEDFGYEPGYYARRELISALKRLGGVVYETDLGTDIKVVEEGTEFMNRLESHENLPMVASSCAGLIEYMEENAPQLSSYLSSCKTPEQISSVLTKNETSMKGKEIYQIAVVSCTAQKQKLKDLDLVLTVPELVKLLKVNEIDLNEIEVDTKELPKNNSASSIHAVTGGLTESILRMVSVMLTDGVMAQIEYPSTRGFKGVKEFTLKISDEEIKFAVVNGIGNAKAIIDEIIKGKSPYHFVEIMACPGGCINGGGTSAKMGNIDERMQTIYRLDEQNLVRRSYEKEEVKLLYQEFLSEPCGKESQMLLHTNYVEQSSER